MRSIFILAFISVSIVSHAQIALEHTFNDYFLEVVNFSNANVGQKFVTNTEQVNFYSHPDTLTIYNADYSVYKSIPLPLNYVYSDFYTLNGNAVPSVSDELFNSDTSFEFIGAQSSSSGNDIYSVINESGQIIFTFPDTSSSGIGVFKIGNEFKLTSHNYCNFTNCISPIHVFSLPGSLPCNQCSGFTSGIEGPNSNGIKMGFDAYPNPFNNTLNINYNMAYQQNAKIILTDILGQELMSIPVNKQSDNLNINTSGIAKGVIVASLYGSNGNMISKKLIKIQ